ncbi:hypothetical protein [Halocatena marina]|uniref:hypothetical protein n=1 Tax=Halocatena marina TaxID=2934937 RepID=UPI0036F3C448
MTLPVATRRTAAGSDAILAIIVGAHCPYTTSFFDVYCTAFEQLRTADTYVRRATTRSRRE